MRMEPVIIFMLMEALKSEETILFIRFPRHNLGPQTIFFGSNKCYNWNNKHFACFPSSADAYFNGTMYDDVFDSSIIFVLIVNKTNNNFKCSFTQYTAELCLNGGRVGDYFGGIVIDLMKKKQNETIEKPQ